MSMVVGGQTMLDKKQAAEYLGVTTRTLERHVKDGKLSVRYEPSQNGEIAIFDPEELENFREGKATVRIKPAIESEQPSLMPKPPQNTQGQITRTPDRAELSQTQQPESIPLGIGTLIAPLGAWLGNLTRAIDNHGSRMTTTELRSKLLLTLEEAQAITGLSREILLDAIKNGELPSKIMGKAYRIKTQDLEQYIANLAF
jgi:excisionase family DNA binding protein